MTKSVKCWPWSSKWYQKDPQGRRGYFRKFWSWKTVDLSENGQDAATSSNVTRCACAGLAIQILNNKINDFPFFRRWLGNPWLSGTLVIVDKVATTKSENLFFHQVCQIWVWWALDLPDFVRNREIYNLGMVSGPVLLKTKAQCRIFILLGSKKSKKKLNI